MPIHELDSLVSSFTEIYQTLATYAQTFANNASEVGGLSDIMFNLPDHVWDEDHFDAGVAENDGLPQSLPWMDELPEKISAHVCIACAQLARMIAQGGLDEHRKHHGFVIIIGDVVALESCGKA